MRVATAAVARPLLCIASAAFFGPVSVAETSASATSDRVESVVVSATRLGQTATESGSSVSVLSADDIQELGFIYALDAVAHAPGVTINQNGAFGGAASVRIRGAGSEQTVVLIDGVPANDPAAPGGGFDLARLDTQNIERIEVLKGPQSTLWGTDAIGGVVSITTRAPAAEFGGDAFAEFGSFNTLRGGASVSNAGAAGDFRLGITSVSSDGISKADEANGNDEDDGFDSLTLSAKGGLNLPGDVRLSADVLWTDADTQFDSFVFGAQGNVGDGDESTQTEEIAANVSLTAPLLDGRLENLLMVGYSDISRESFSGGLPGFMAEGDRLLLRYQGTLAAGPGHRLAFGAEREEITASDEDTSIDGLFALYEYKPVDDVTMTAGVRRDDHERFGGETTGRIAGAWRVSAGVSLRASWGQGFKAPTLFQTTFFCCGATEPNPDLVPETSDAFDVGLVWTSGDGRAQLGASVFRQDTENLIDFDFVLGGYLNIAQVESTGVELFGAYTLSDSLSVTFDYAYIDAENGNGDALPRLPRHSGDVALSYDPGNALSGAVLVRYNASEANTDGSQLDSWLRVDVTGRYAISERFEAYGRIENLLDEDYQQVLGYGTPGLSGSLGVRLRY